MQMFNIIAAIFMSTLVIIAFFLPRRVMAENPWYVRHEKILFWAIAALTILVRVIAFLEVPGGLNQDEASMGYDAWATAFFGIDRNGTHMPVYAISWGSGQNVLLMYITAVFVRIFGLSVFTARLGSLLLGVSSPIVLYFLVKRLSASETARDKAVKSLTAMFMLAICPWHIMISRWALESNALPGVFLIAVYLIVVALQNKNTLSLCAAAAVLALSMYSYATVCLIMPLFVLCLAVFLLWKKTIPLRRILCAAGVFAIISVPIILFYIVNIFKLGEIATPLFTVPRLTTFRSTVMLDSVAQNFYNLIKLIITQNDGLIWNSIESIGTTYIFLTPFLPIGIWAVARRRGHSLIMALWLACAVILGSIINININRINFIYIPIVYFICEGIYFTAERVAGKAGYLICAAVLVGFIAFNVRYFGGEYGGRIARQFYDGFGDAVKFADALDTDKIYVKDGNYTLVLFFSQMNPHEFADTVVYSHPDAEFRPVITYGKFSTIFPAEADMDAAYIIQNSRVGEFADFNIRTFENYSVAY
ncbi:MAG: glycosyltransferase family 39 protein [Clostridiales bacterium]|nr:glycosyltransferase family 39 protein [Clostridiales bacterium]